MPVARYTAPLILTLPLLMAPGALGAESLRIVPDYSKAAIKRWRCRLCIFEEDASPGRLALTALHVAADETRFGRDNDLNEGTIRVVADGRYLRRSPGGATLDARGRNIGLDSQEAVLRAVGSSRYEWALSYRGIVRHDFDGVRSPFAGSSALQLPATWTPAFTTGDMTGLAALGRTQTLGTRRGKLSTKGWYRPDERWRIDLAYDRETKTGERASSGDFLYAAAGLVQPIDYRTDRYRAGLTYDSATWLLSVRYDGSEFDNRDRSLIWDNPYQAVGGETSAEKGLAPDNEMHRLAVESMLRLGTHTQLSAVVSRGKRTQDADFLAYTINPTIPVEPLPAPSLDGEMRVSAALLRITSRISRKLHLALRIGRARRDNDTASLSLSPILGDRLADAPTPARLFAFEATHRSLKIRYRPFRKLQVRLSLERRDRHRSHAEITTNREEGGALRLVYRASSGVKAALEYARSDRDAGTFRPITNNNPLTRRFHQAKQERRSLSFGLRRAFAGGLAIGVEASRDAVDYPASPLGLQHHDGSSATADMSYATGAGSSIAAYYTRHRRDAMTFGSLAFAAHDWTYDARDTAAAYGVVLSPDGWLPENLALTIDYVRSRGRGRYETWSAGGLGVFPALVSDLEGIALHLSYRVNERFRIEARGYYEEYDAADWALDGVDPATISNVLALGLRDPRYANYLAGFTLHYDL